MRIFTGKSFSRFQFTRAFAIFSPSTNPQAMTKQVQFLLLIILPLLWQCQSSKKLSSATDDGQIELIFLQINDVYEIAPLGGGKVGGMARVASLRQQLLAENPNTLSILAGDFLNPSVIGTLRYQGDPIKGKQMIEVMNACGIDLVTFGNHEFDLKEKELQKRLNESTFAWVSSNVLHKTPQSITPFEIKNGGQVTAIPDTWVWEIQDSDGTQLKVGLFGVTLDSNPQDYVMYKDHEEEALKAIKRLRSEVDVIIGITHLEEEQDLALAKKVQEVPLLMGGHDHHHMVHQVGNVRLTKADANAKTAYVHRLKYNKNTKTYTLDSQLVPIDPSLPMESKTDAVVQKWNQIAIETFQSAGFDPNEEIVTVDQPLDGRESKIRHGQTNLGAVITKAMSWSVQNQNDCSILNSGSIRLDDQLSGTITQYDMIRTMPYGGSVLQVKMRGQLVRAVLDEGERKKGRGAYLQRDKVDWDANTKNWMINGQPLDDQAEYQVMLNDFLLRGLDIEVLKSDSEGVLSIQEPSKEDESDLRRDIRLLVNAYLKSQH